MTSWRGAGVYEAVTEQRCAGGASSGATCVTSKRMDQGRVFKSIARSAVVLHFLTGFRTEQVALSIWQRTLLSRVRRNAAREVDGGL